MLIHEVRGLRKGNKCLVTFAGLLSIAVYRSKVKQLLSELSDKILHKM